MADDNSGCCNNPVCKAWNNSGCGKFVNAYPSHLFNFIVAWILFGAIGLPTVATYSYSGASYSEALEHQASNGALVSGRFGQGVFPMTLITTLVASFIYMRAAIEFCGRKEDEDDE
eukprot:g1586.t1